MPITLTEAFGCQRCQKIFVLKPDKSTIEELSTSHPYKRTWYWSGHQWHPAHRRVSISLGYLLLGFFILLLMLLFLLLLPAEARTPKVIFLLVMITVFLMAIAWFAPYRY
jgi:asparagine N-glycosylation enzyme membrane subunit Stt3